MANPSSLSIPGQQMQNNPLVTLNERLEDVITAIRGLSDTHQYVLIHAGEQRWVVACEACSNREGRAIHPCRVQPDGAAAPPAAFDAQGMNPQSA